MTAHQTNRLLLLLCGCCLSFVSFAQSVKGRVMGDNDEPLPGVSVRVKNGAQGTSTNEKGEFILKVQEGTLLEFSFVGYKPVTEKAEVSFMAVRLTRNGDAGMSDVVVVGYSTQKRTSVSGSVSVITTKSLEDRPVTNSVQALQGLSPGLVITRSSGQPGYENWNINIRGVSSLNGTNNPLVIVDGVEYQNLTLINPDDIESISVLKDASAAAIYGAKASNGVLLVTTKSGKGGRLTLSYTGMYEIKKPLSLPQTVPYHISATIQDSAYIAYGAAAPYTAAQIAMFADPSVTFVPNDPTNIFYYGEQNYVGMTIKKNFGAFSHDLSLTGGNDKTKYFIGLGYTDNNGLLKVGPDGNKRYNARINLSTKFNKIFSLDSRLSFTQNSVAAAAGTLEGDYGLLYNIFNLRPISPVFVPGNNSEYLSGVNTYATLKSGGYNDTRQDVLDAVFSLKATDIVKGLVLTANYSPHLEQDNQDMFFKTVPLYSWDKTSQSFLQNAWVNKSNSINKYRTTQTSYTTNFLGEYGLGLGDHHFRLLGGFQYQYYNYNRLDATQTNLVNNNLGTVNYTTNATLPVTAISDSIQDNAWRSFFGRFNYDYNNKYFFEATVRDDASSRLAPGHRSQAFPALSAAWRVSQEKWFEASDILNELKLRGSWGKLGNAQLGQPYQNNYLSVPTLVNGVYPFNNAATTYVYQNALPSDALGWETVTTTDLGVDFSFLKRRLTGSFDVYKRVNDNMLITVNLPAVLGVAPSTSNAAAMQTKGWDLELNWKDQIGKVRYYAGVNLSDNKNKITKYLGNVVYTEGLNQAIPGLPINSIFGYKSLGYFQSQDDVVKSPKQFGATNQGPGDIKYADVNKDNLINGGTGTAANHGDLVYLGNTSPRYNFGIMLGGEYKGFDLSLFFQGTGKRSYMIYSYEAIPFIQSWRYPLANYVGNYWTPTHTDARFPRPIYGGGTNTHVSSSFVQNGSYIRLKNLQIGYSLPEEFVRQVKVEKIRVFVSGQDIWTATKAWYKYFDPESPNNASYSYPFTSTYAFGLNVTF